MCTSVLAYGLHTTRVAHVVGIPKFPSPPSPLFCNRQQANSIAGCRANRSQSFNCLRSFLPSPPYSSSPPPSIYSLRVIAIACTTPWPPFNRLRRVYIRAQLPSSSSSSFSSHRFLRDHVPLQPVFIITRTANVGWEVYGSVMSMFLVFGRGGGGM